MDTESGKSLRADTPEEQAPDGSDGGNGILLEIPRTPVETTGEPNVSRISAVTFADSVGRGTAATNVTGATAGRKIHRKDVRQIFKASGTTGTVTMEQILRIKKMHNKISDGVNWDFNYSCLLMVASIVAGLGLATDSSTTVISSMLLSPIMGPVIGMSYGLIIWDLPLIKRSMKNEILSIIICVIFGVLLALFCGKTHMAGRWPTKEMLSRGTRETFLAGIPIAFFSGLGVALSVLDDQTSSLVGVAISASLLPPAVNCGMLLVVALINGNDWSHFSLDYENQLELQNSSTHKFSDMAILSLLLTIANVIMVALGATLMFRAKEVLPVKKKVFWDDLKIARRLYQGRAVDSVTGEALNFEECARIALEHVDEDRPDTISKHPSDQIETQ